MRALVFDIETCSVADLTKVGSWLYARHLSTRARCVSYCLVIDSTRGPIETWQPGEPVPQTIIDFAADVNASAIAFNNAFDRQIWDRILTPRYSFPAIAFERHRCAQAAALARALPASLDAAAAALKITTRKTKEGMAAMKRLAKPRRVDCIGLLPDAEQALWRLDQLINERGVHVDIQLIDAALSIGEEARLELHHELAELTDGAVSEPAQPNPSLAQRTRL
jgi:DNA polymerase